MMLNKSLGMLLICMSLSVGTVGCSVFTAYPDTHREGVRSFDRGDFPKALSNWSAQESGGDAFLNHLERGMIQHTAGHLEHSNQEFFTALQWLKDWEDRPTISMRSGLEGALSFVLNDKTLPYDGEGFERVMLHSFLALNFYLLNQFDGAYVEIRRAYEMQREEERKYSTIYPTQSAFARYLSGMVREAVGEPGEAYIDYQRVWELNPKFRFVRNDLLRLSKLLGYENDYNRWQQEFRQHASTPSLDSQTVDCILIFQCGQAPVKVPVEIAIAFHSGVTKWVAPNYKRRHNPVAKVRLVANQVNIGETSILEDVESIAFRNLKDRLDWISAKATSRAIAKGVLTHNLFQKEQWVGALLGTLFTLATEQADLRSWLTLPRNIQLLRTPLEHGSYDFSVELLDHSGKVVSQSDLGQFRLRPAERIIFNVRSVGRSTFTFASGGQPVEGVSP